MNDYLKLADEAAAHNGREDVALVRRLEQAVRELVARQAYDDKAAIEWANILKARVAERDEARASKDRCLAIARDEEKRSEELQKDLDEARAELAKLTGGE